MPSVIHSTESLAGMDGASARIALLRMSTTLESADDFMLLVAVSDLVGDFAKVHAIGECGGISHLAYGLFQTLRVVEKQVLAGADIRGSRDKPFSPSIMVAREITEVTANGSRAMRKTLVSSPPMSRLCANSFQPVRLTRPPQWPRLPGLSQVCAAHRSRPPPP
jgi:hypothetical protein